MSLFHSIVRIESSIMVPVLVSLWVILSIDFYQYDCWTPESLPPWISFSTHASFTDDNTFFLPHFLLWEILSLTFSIWSCNNLGEFHRGILKKFLHNIRQRTLVQRSHKFTREIACGKSGYSSALCYYTQFQYVITLL